MTTTLAWRKRHRSYRSMWSDSSRSAGNHDGSEPVSTRTPLTERRGPGCAGFSSSTTILNVPMSPVMAPMLTPSTPIGLRVASIDANGSPLSILHQIFQRTKDRTLCFFVGRPTNEGGPGSGVVLSDLQQSLFTSIFEAIGHEEVVLRTVGQVRSRREERVFQRHVRNELEHEPHLLEPRADRRAGCRKRAYSYHDWRGKLVLSDVRSKSYYWG